MYRAVALDMLDTDDLVPQAIIGRSVSSLASELKISFVHGHDDLDQYDIAVVKIESGRLSVIFALKHYPGYPENTTTIYLPGKFHNVEEITDILGVIGAELRIPKSMFLWQRADNPDF